MGEIWGSGDGEVGGELEASGFLKGGVCPICFGRDDESGEIEKDGAGGGGFEIWGEGFGKGEEGGCGGFFPGGVAVEEIEIWAEGHGG